MCVDACMHTCIINHKVVPKRVTKILFKLLTEHAQTFKYLLFAFVNGENLPLNPLVLYSCPLNY